MKGVFEAARRVVLAVMVTDVCFVVGEEKLGLGPALISTWLQPGVRVRRPGKTALSGFLHLLDYQHRAEAWC